MNVYRHIRTIAFFSLMGVPLLMLVFGFSRLSAQRMHIVDMRGMVAEAGGWSPSSFTVGVGDLVRLRLTSGDVWHGFAIGQTDFPAVDVKPGATSELSVTFDRPGKYVFYCTHWCSLGHWRMRGTIEVLPSSPKPQPVSKNVPLYVQLGVDIDAAHPAAVAPAQRPSAAHGASLGVTLPGEYLSPDYYRAHSPAQIWQTLRALPATQNLTDADIWDLVAHIWDSNASTPALATGKQLYTANCSACHGDAGAGDGQMAAVLGSKSTSEFGSGTLTPTNFTNPATMLGASPALLQGKIMRGGMGTGMPYWGPVFSEQQMWAIIDYLWTFPMEYQTKP
jgi:mono/diheme cytochrome c family protein/plastocyanin